MSYALLLSTTSSNNLEDFNDDLLTFDSRMWNLDEEEFLTYSNKWLVLSPDGCSGGFRYVSEDLGFGLPKDWYPEEHEDILATKRLIEIIRKLVQNNEKVECINAWLEDVKKTHIKKSPIEELKVNLNKVSNEEFRFHGYKRYDFVENT